MSTDSESPVKSLEFATYAAFLTWKELNYPFVRVLSMGGPYFFMSYDLMPKPLASPWLSITYLEFPRPV